MIIKELNLEEKETINGGDLKGATNAFVGTLATAGAVIAASTIPVSGAMGAGATVVLVGDSSKKIW
ncbi:hypothetical protein KX935_00140 [Streptobacillus moniliformis]|nr:hypothetical protein KX935_00140 [Streptobacillus moniliformis]